MASTSIRVPLALRDRINLDARERGVAPAHLIEELLDSYERRKRMEGFGRSLRGADQEYWDDFHDRDLA